MYGRMLTVRLGWVPNGRTGKGPLLLHFFTSFHPTLRTLLLAKLLKQFVYGSSSYVSRLGACCVQTVSPVVHIRLTSRLRAGCLGDLRHGRKRGLSWCAWWGANTEERIGGLRRESRPLSWPSSAKLTGTEACGQCLLVLDSD